MQDLYKELIQLLEQDPALIIEDKLNKALIIDRALKLDTALLKLLLSNPNIKKQFFADLDGVLVFDKIAFQRFVNSKMFLQDSYTQYKNKIGLSTDNENYLTDSREVVLVWPHKDCVLEGGQTKEDAKRNEIFYNTFGGNAYNNGYMQFNYVTDDGSSRLVTFLIEDDGFETLQLKSSGAWFNGKFGQKQVMTLSLTRVGP